MSQDSFGLIASSALVLGIFAPVLISFVDWKGFEKWWNRNQQHKIKVLIDTYKISKGTYIVDHFDQGHNEITFMYDGSKKSLQNYLHEPQYEYLGRIHGKELKKIETKKGKSMPRIIKFAFYLMLLILMWKLVTHAETITLFLTKRFIGGL